MTDRELLEFAAKAAGIELTWQQPSCGGGELPYMGWGSYTPTVWSPLTDDGGALRLAVKLKIHPETFTDYTIASYQPNADSDWLEVEVWGDDPYAATRRAIVRAAAAIGKETP